MSRQLSLPLRNPAKRDREDFVVSRENSAAIARLDAWNGGLLVIVGAAGVGKSHIAGAWARRHGATELDPQIQLSRLVDLADRVLLDDADRGVADELLFHLINRSERPGGALLLTARTPPSDWSTSLPDLRSRLNAAPVLELAEPDEAALEQLLRLFFRERSIAPSPELLAYLVRRIERAAAGARQVVADLDEASQAQGRPVGRGLARLVLHDDSPAARS